MNRRFSLSGKGADIFFDPSQAAPPEPETPSPSQPAQAPPMELASSNARQTDISPAGKPDRPQPRQTDRQQESKTARQTDVDFHDAAAQADSLRSLEDALAQPHPVHNTFRYAQSELDSMRDLVYELEVKRGVKLTRNDILRLGLNFVLGDYRERGEESLLLRVFGKDRSRRL